MIGNANPRKDHIYFNPGELSLLLAEVPSDSDEKPKASREDGEYESLTLSELGALNKLLSQVTDGGTPAGLHPQNFLIGPNGKPRTLVPMRRTVGTTESTYYLQTVNLSSWSIQPVEQQEGDDLERAVDEVTTAVRTLTALLQIDEDTTLGRYTIIAASPNWRAAPSSWCGPPSPAGRPLAVEPEEPLRVFREERVRETIQFLTKHLHNQTPSKRNVRVAVFDTWPFDEYDALFDTVEAQLEALDNSANNGRLRRAASGMMVNRVVDFVGPFNLDQIGAPLSRFDISGGRDQAYDMRDHGLFVADIIDQIAPEAELHVYRILTNAGPVDVDTLARAVEHALDGARRDDVKLVLNFSFGFGLDLLTAVDLLTRPRDFLDDRHDEGWVNTASSKAQSKTAWKEDKDAWRQNIFALLTGNSVAGEHPLFEERSEDPERYQFINAIALLQRLFYFKDMDNFLAVAAAGNQSIEGKFFPPQLPAAIEGILGVSAVREDGKDSDYSNADDVLPPDDGISALGGAVNGLNTSDGPMALFLSSVIPDGNGSNGNGTQNDSGRAIWAGTSFATPIASGIAARLWMEYGDNSAQDIINAIVSDGTDEGRHFIPHGRYQDKPLQQE